MNIEEAKHECQRWLSYLDKQKEKSTAIQQIAGDLRNKKCDEAEAKKRLRNIDNASVVYDGSKLAEAVKTLLKYVS